MKLAFFFLLFSANLLGQSFKKGNVALGAHYLSTIDYSIQKPDGLSSFKCSPPGSVGDLSFEAQVALPFTRIFQIETGYRFKQHSVSFKNEYLLSSEWVETTHSVPLRVGVITKLKKQGFLNRLSIGFSCGALFDIMEQSESAPLLINGQQFQLTTSAGSYLMKSAYNPDEVNQVKASISFDGYMQISYRMFKIANIYFGYGYTQGTRTLAKGYYTISEPTGITRTGSMRTNGTYRYGMLGLRFLLQKKSRKV